MCCGGYLASIRTHPGVKVATILNVRGPGLVSRASFFPPSPGKRELPGACA